MKYLLLLAFVFFCISGTNAQYHSYNAALSGMGGSGIAIDDFQTGMNNQAAWGNLNCINVGVGYNSKFMLKELSDRYISFAMPVSKDAGVFGLNLNQYGYSQYNITKAGLCFARNFSPDFSVGLQFDAFHVGTADEMYGNATAFTFECGFLYRLNNKISLGTAILNPVQAKLSKYTQEQLPVSLALGMSYQPSKVLLLSADIVKEQFHPASLRAGFKYLISESLILRGGFSSAYFSVSGGVGVRFNTLTVDISTSYHQVLGISPSVTISYAFDKN
jgi:hypothetical protein